MNIVIQQEDSSVAEILVMIGVPECRRKGLAAAALALMMWYSQVGAVYKHREMLLGMRSEAVGKPFSKFVELIRVFS